MKVQGNDLGLCGVEQLFHVGDVAYNTTDIDDGLPLFKLPHKAIITRAVAVVDEAFNAGTTNVLIVGTEDDDDALMASGDITEGTTGAYSKQTFLTMDAGDEVYVKFTETGTAATTGKASIYVFAVGIPE